MEFWNFWKRKEQEFRPDTTRGNWLKTLRMTQLQRLRLLKWLSYAAALILAVVIQDVLMSQIRIFGATTNLPVCVILLITVLEGTEVGSLFVLITSVLYYFTGSAPGAYSIALLCFPGIGVTLLRQMYFNRSRGSIVICAALAAFAYEVGIWAVGVFSVLTRWDRLPVFLVTAGYDLLVLFLIYPLIVKIGQIGGNTWKE